MDLAKDAIDFLVGAELKGVEIAAECARENRRVLLTQIPISKRSKAME